MQELFENIRPEIKRVAEGAWNLTMAQENPASAAELLNSVVEYYRNIYTEEEVEFLQFYFQMRMEMMKK